MGSTSFLGFSYPNLVLNFSELFRNLYNMFLARLKLSVGTFSGSFLFYFYFYFSVPGTLSVYTCVLVSCPCTVYVVCILRLGMFKTSSSPS